MKFTEADRLSVRQVFTGLEPAEEPLAWLAYRVGWNEGAVAQAARAAADTATQPTKVLRIVRDGDGRMTHVVEEHAIVQAQPTRSKKALAS